MLVQPCVAIPLQWGIPAASTMLGLPYGDLARYGRVLVAGRLQPWLSCRIVRSLPLEALNNGTPAALARGSLDRLEACAELEKSILVPIAVGPSRHLSRLEEMGFARRW